MERDFARLAQKIDALRSLDKEYEIFGSKEHKYLFNPKISDKEIEQFEKEHGIVLPSEYRLFISTIGNGGCGPYYGLLPLREYNEHYYEHCLDEEDENKSFLRYPFPFKDRWVPRDDIDEDNTIKSISGTLALSHEGCGYYTLLIVTGEERGNIWLDAVVTNQGMTSIKRNGKKIGFLEWYENWVDKSILELIEKKNE